MREFEADRPLLGLNVHPGEILLEEFMKPMKLNAAALARALDVSTASLSRIVNGRQGVSAEMAFRLARAFGTSPAFWIDLQSQYDLTSLSEEARARIERDVRRLAEAG